MDRIALRNFLAKHFSIVELDALCFEHFADLRPLLNTQWTPQQYAQKLVELCESRNLLGQLEKVAEDGSQKSKKAQCEL